MAIYLQHGLFIHVPKTGGRWVKAMIERHVKGWQHSGDPVYDSHDTPEPAGRIPFWFVREPGTFAHSLWHHRARKKANTRGHTFNWQTYIRLERECQSTHYEEFMACVARCQDGVADYFDFYTGRYEEAIYGKMEQQPGALIDILEDLGEDYDADALLAAGHERIGDGHYQIPVADDLRLAINRANRSFCERHGYDL